MEAERKDQAVEAKALVGQDLVVVEVAVVVQHDCVLLFLLLLVCVWTCVCVLDAVAVLGVCGGGVVADTQHGCCAWPCR